MSFETIQEFYQLGMWNVADLKQLVESGVITAEQFTAITGQDYVVFKPVPTAKEPVRTVLL